MEWYVPPVVPSDVAITPAWIAAWLRSWAEVDPCAHPQQLVYAAHRVCLPDDGLAFLRDLTTGVRGWLNPPWSHPASWIAEILDNVAQRGGSWHVLVRGDTSTRWARMLAEAVRSFGGWIGVTKHRQSFGAVDPARPDVPAVFGNPFPYPCLLAGIGRSVLQPPLDRLLFVETRTLVARTSIAVPMESETEATLRARQCEDCNGAGCYDCTNGYVWEAQPT